MTVTIIEAATRGSQAMMCRTAALVWAAATAILIACGDKRVNFGSGREERVPRNVSRANEGVA
jgi:hypothetical protein